MTRSSRLLLTTLLSLLLIGMQLGAQLHALEHVREALTHSRDYSLVVPGDEACAVCTFFASGANAIAGDIGETFVSLAAPEPATSTPVSVTPAFFSYYQTRAPPALL